MQEKIYELYCEIKNETKKFVEVRDILGKDDVYVNQLSYKIYGMMEAFEVIAGEPYTTYMYNMINCA